MSDPTLAVLRRVRERLSTPDRWMQYGLARNSLGQAIWPEHSDAACWCLAGAIIAETFFEGGTGTDAAHLIRSEIGLGGSITNWNDDPKRTHAEVLALLDRVIGGAA